MAFTRWGSAVACCAWSRSRTARRHWPPRSVKRRSASPIRSPNPDDSAATSGANVVSVSQSGVTLSAQSDIARGSVGLQLGDTGGRLRQQPERQRNLVGRLDRREPRSNLTDRGRDHTRWLDRHQLLRRLGRRHELERLLLAPLPLRSGRRRHVSSEHGRRQRGAAIGASFDGTDLTANLIFTPDPSNPAKMLFTMSYATPVVTVASSGFFDALTVDVSKQRPRAVVRCDPHLQKPALVVGSDGVVQLREWSPVRRSRAGDGGAGRARARRHRRRGLPIDRSGPRLSRSVRRALRTNYFAGVMFRSRLTVPAYALPPLRATS